MKRLIIIPLLFFTLILSATNYYVKTGGSDAANGLTDGTAWLTINKVNTSTFQPGDSILFKKGDTWRETLTVPTSGSAAFPIIIGKYGVTGVDPIIDGSALLTSWTSEVVGAGDVERETQTTTSAAVPVFKYSDRIYVATDVLAAATYALSEIKVNLTKAASPVMNINCYLYSNVAGNPTSLLATSSTTLNAANIINGTDHAFTFDQSFTVVNGTTYWIVLKGSTYDGTNCVNWNGAYSGGSIMNDADGTGAWGTIIGWHMAFRMKGYTNQFTAYYATGTIPNAVWQDGVYMLKKLSKTALSVNSFFWDSANNRIYVITTTDADPTATFVISSAKRDYGIDTNDKEYSVIKNLTLRYANKDGVHIKDNSTHITIKDCDIYGNGFNINFIGSYGIVLRCTIHDNHMIVDDAAPDTDYGAVGVNIENSNIEISYCTFTNLYAPSTDYGEDGGGIEISQYGTSVVENISIHHNRFTNTSGLLEMGGRNNGGIIRNVSLYDNICYDNRPWTDVISIHTGGTFTVTIANITMFNNTFVSVGSSSGAFMWFASNPTAGTFVMRNNIFYLSNMTVMTAQTIAAADHTYNLYYNPITPEWTPGYALGTGEIETENPDFVDPTSDFHLQDGSPAIDAGLNIGLTTDYSGHTIPYNLTPDIGAYEYGTWILMNAGKVITSGGKVLIITK